MGESADSGEARQGAARLGKSPPSPNLLGQGQLGDTGRAGEATMAWVTLALAKAGEKL